MISPRLLLLTGSFLVSLPIFAEVFRGWQFADLGKFVVAANGSLTYPEPPVVWYSLAACIGASLIMLGVFLGMKK